MPKQRKGNKEAKKPKRQFGGAKRQKKECERNDGLRGNTNFTW